MLFYFVIDFNQVKISKYTLQIKKMIKIAAFYFVLFNFLVCTAKDGPAIDKNLNNNQPFRKANMDVKPYFSLHFLRQECLFKGGPHKYLVPCREICPDCQEFPPYSWKCVNIPECHCCD